MLGLHVLVCTQVLNVPIQEIEVFSDLQGLHSSEEEKRNVGIYMYISACTCTLCACCYYNYMYIHTHCTMYVSW